MDNGGGPYDTTPAVIALGVAVLLFAILLPLVNARVRRRLLRRGRQMFPHREQSVAYRSGHNVLEVEIDGSIAEIWEGSGSERGWVTSVFIEHDHDVDLLIQPQDRAPKGRAKKRAWLTRPLGYTADLEVGLPEVDDAFLIRARKGDPSVGRLLRTDTFLELLRQLRDLNLEFALFLFPRSIRRRQRMFESDNVVACGYRPGILMNLVGTMEHIGASRLDALAAAASRARMVLGRYR